MSVEELAEFKERCRDRWRRMQDAFSWSKGPMATWKPVLSEQQKQEHDEYVRANRLPF